MSVQPTSRELFIFNEGKTFIENITVRTDGTLLLSTFENGRLYSLDPKAAAPKPELVAEFPGANGITGVVANSPNVFTVTGGEQKPFRFTLGSMKVYTVTLPGPGQPAVVKTVAEVPDTEMLNGLAALPSRPHVVLSADSIRGRIFRIDTATGAVDVAFSDPALEPDDAFPLGVNGLKIFGSHLYFANSAKGSFGRVPIGPDGSKTGDVEIVARIPGAPGPSNVYDDFDIARRPGGGGGGNPTAYVAAMLNKVFSIDLVTGEQKLFFGGGDSTALVRPTSVATAKDGKSIYVVTAGFEDFSGPAKGQVVEIPI
ncbi:uncharacterized protein F4812DRAFT_464530 [Daldinia caldariorum]|uniref:uncharacterized protein n=1 Tax=Daldinia caldariorum TaxID=326644 RepID=UPI002007564A|nr:uncharacterized protein F4812DRAFT_464530 [Daldinia caldariorum]KAI1472422.1 hypothetical protein F4812DRAFT_464530 [Daldinia caldariorum]